jgi:Na+-transporting methylmalonyl-CoA/oxaloacetate decarboxylase gamma subunit
MMLVIIALLVAVLCYQVKLVKKLTKADVATTENAPDKKQGELLAAVITAAITQYKLSQR